MHYFFNFAVLWDNIKHYTRKTNMGLYRQIAPGRKYTEVVLQVSVNALMKHPASYRQDLFIHCKEH